MFSAAAGGVRAAAPETEGRQSSVLVIDDERGPRESLQWILRASFRVFTAESGERGLEVIREHPIDVVTLDLKMPGLSGPQTMAMMKDIDPELEVVIVTGYGSFESALEVLRLRAFDYIEKPFEAERIVKVVRQAADARERRLAVAARGAARMAAPLGQIVEEVERWQEHAHLEAIERAELDRIVERLRSLRTVVRKPTFPNDVREPPRGGKEKE